MKLTFLSSSLQVGRSQEHSDYKVVPGPAFLLSSAVLVTIAFATYMKTWSAQ
jgi:hypothetical protein